MEYRRQNSAVHSPIDLCHSDVLSHSVVFCRLLCVNLWCMLPYGAASVGGHSFVVTPWNTGCEIGVSVFPADHRRRPEGTKAESWEPISGIPIFLRNKNEI